LNFAREGVVDEAAMVEALNSGKAHAYVSDFPTNLTKNHPRCITLPHLGASTGEAEDNCAIMVAEQVRDFLENGNITNSVNFPEVKLPRKGSHRLAIANKNLPDMVGQMSHILGSHKVNIVHMVNESRGDLAYTLIDVEGEVPAAAAEAIRAIDGVLNVRVI
ncbi:MAG: 3-phosphoglycerate dehydrogenase, partial [Halothiobacillaceae bacterium]